MAFSPDGERFTTGGTLRDTATGEVLRYFVGSGGVRGAFSPDGTLVVTAGSDGFARLWGNAILVSAGPHGTVDPAGRLVKGWETSADFTATPDDGYAVDQWLVDGQEAQRGGTAFTLSDIQSNHTVLVTFRFLGYTITPSAGAHGVINPNQPTLKEPGDSQGFIATAEDGYAVQEWRVDGAVAQTGGTAFTLSNIQASHVVRVTFVFVGYTLTASAGSHGVVNPSASLLKQPGESQIFLAGPDDGYAVDEWLVDGQVAQTGGASFTLSNIRASHSVQVTFVFVGYTMRPLAGEHGRVTPDQPVLRQPGESQTFVAQPDEGYTVDLWQLDGQVVQAGQTGYTLNDIQASHTVRVSFRMLSFAITADAQAHGTLEPHGEIQADWGTSVFFTASPDPGYAVAAWLLDGETAQEGGSSYLLSDIKASHDIAVSFVFVGYTVTPSAGPHGAIDPAEPVIKQPGQSQSFTATPARGFAVKEWRVDGELVQVGGESFLLTDIQRPHTVQVTFRQTCDANWDGVVNALDLQLTVNAVLGVDISPYSGDVNDDGHANAVDVQLVVNEVLGVSG